MATSLSETNKQYYEVIVHMLRAHGVQNKSEFTLSYADLRKHCDNKFDGIQALLRTMRRNKIVYYVGDTFTDESMEITLLSDVDETAYTPKESILYSVYNLPVMNYQHINSGGKSGAC
eukprot:TRINITY_DN13175_c0_g1_i1.p1 TRINITY_DN13175_c0_g1~~TRINITY_DN13175_c0_g1_i1.p1  ORF type:complete len:126 (+),score=55.23 TRINITY_DN13175_c0_g1_i1:26-379(+)